MHPNDKCDLTISEKEIGNAKITSPDVLEALYDQAKAAIDADGTVCITRADVIVKRITTPAELAEFCSAIKSY